MPSNYILWGAVILIAILALLWLLYCNYWLPRFAARFDTKVRFQVVKRFMKENPQLADQSRHEYMRRVHWAVLTMCGLPPLSIVKIWLRTNKPYILAPTDQIEKYMIENEGKPLPNGELDPQIRNGQGRMILKLLWSLERSERHRSGNSITKRRKS